MSQILQSLTYIKEAFFYSQDFPSRNVEYFLSYISTRKALTNNDIDEYRKGFKFVMDQNATGIPLNHWFISGISVFTDEELKNIQERCKPNVRKRKFDMNSENNDQNDYSAVLERIAESMPTPNSNCNVKKMAKLDFDAVLFDTEALKKMNSNLAPFPESVWTEFRTFDESDHVSLITQLTGNRGVGKTSFTQCFCYTNGYQYIAFRPTTLRSFKNEDFMTFIVSKTEFFKKVLVHLQLNEMDAMEYRNLRLTAPELLPGYKFLMILETNTPSTIDVGQKICVAFPPTTKLDRLAMIEYFCGPELGPVQGQDRDKLAQWTVGFEIVDLKQLLRQLARRGEFTPTSELQTAVTEKRRSLANQRARLFVQDVSWEDVGGHDSAKTALHSLVTAMLVRDAGSSRGVLLEGEPGIGKTMLVRALSNETGLALVEVRGADLAETRGPREARTTVERWFRAAEAAQPAILLVDDAHTPFSCSGNSSGDPVTCFLNQLDSLARQQQRPQVLVVCTARSGLHEALLRPHRLATRVQLAPPKSPVDRLAVLTALFRCAKFQSEEDRVTLLSKVATDNFTRDWSQATLATLTKVIRDQECVTMEMLSEVLLQHRSYSKTEFGQNALVTMHPDLVIENLFDYPQGTDVYLSERLPISPDLRLQRNLCALICGEEGCGKTNLVKKLAKERGSHLIMLKKEYFSNFNVSEFQEQICQFSEDKGDTFVVVVASNVSNATMMQILSLNFETRNNLVVFLECVKTSKDRVYLPDFSENDRKKALRVLYKRNGFSKEDKLNEALKLTKGWGFRQFNVLLSSTGSAPQGEAYLIEQVHLINTCLC